MTTPALLPEDQPLPVQLQQVPQPAQPAKPSQVPPQAGRPTFEQQRQQQEAMVLPRTDDPVPRTSPRATPCSQRPLHDEEDGQLSITVDLNEKTKLPRGWKHEHCHIDLDESVMDAWELNGNFLTRQHFAPRQKDYIPDEDTCPLPLHFLDKKKVVSMGTVP